MSIEINKAGIVSCVLIVSFIMAIGPSLAFPSVSRIPDLRKLFLKACKNHLKDDATKLSILDMIEKWGD